MPKAMAGGKNPFQTGQKIQWQEYRRYDGEKPQDRVGALGVGREVYLYQGVDVGLDQGGVIV